MGEGISAVLGFAVGVAVSPFPVIAVIPAPGEATEMPKWMSSIDTLTPGKSLGLGMLLAGVNPKNLMLAIAAGTSLAQFGLATGDAAVSLVVFVAVASLTIIGPVVY